MSARMHERDDDSDGSGCAGSSRSSSRSHGTSYTSVDPGSGAHYQHPSPHDDEVDHVPVRGPSRQDDELNSQKSTCIRIGSNRESKPERSAPNKNTEATSRWSQASGYGSRHSPTHFSGSHSSAGIPTIPVNTSPSKSYSASNSSDSYQDSGILSASTDLQSIAIIIDRIKRQRQNLEKDERCSSRTDDSSSEPVFQPVGPSNLDPSVTGSLAGHLSNLGTSFKTSKNKQFKLNKQFLEKLLEFEASSPFTSSSSSYASNLHKETRKPGSRINEMKSHISTSSTSGQEYSNKDTMDSRILSGNLDSTSSSSEQSSYKQATPTNKQHPKADDKLRYYIEKLLSMKHEDIRDLSVSSLSSESRTRPGSASSQVSRPSLVDDCARSSSASDVTLTSSSTLTTQINTPSQIWQGKRVSHHQGSLHSSLKSSGSSTIQSSDSAGKHVRFESQELEAETYERREDGSSTNFSMDRTLYRSLQISK
jgi:hypothetical protein